MARDIEWASFAPGVRVGGSSTEQPAMAANGAIRMYEDTVEGNHCLVIAEKDKKPINVPWHMVGSFVYVPVAAPAPVAKGITNKGKPTVINVGNEP